MDHKGVFFSTWLFMYRQNFMRVWMLSTSYCYHWTLCNLCNHPSSWFRWPVEITTKEYVAVLIELYKNTVSVSCVGSHFLSDWALYTVNPQPLLFSPLLYSINRWHTPWHTVRMLWCYDIHLDWIWSWADIDRNCNTFFIWNPPPYKTETSESIHRSQ